MEWSCVTAGQFGGDGFAFSARARPDSSVEVREDGQIIVRCTGKGYGWPGVEIRPAERTDAWDWSGACELELVVSNRGDRAEKIVSGVGGKDERILVYQGTGVPAHSTRSLTIPLSDFGYATDGTVELGEGLKSTPPAVNADDGFGRTTIVTVYNEQPGVQHPLEFSVLSMKVRKAARRPYVISAHSFFPFVDRYGQFAHGDWSGKVHSDAELSAAFRSEDKWLAAHPASPVPEVDEYGGWKSGPQLKATGFFRTEKVDGKWWFVDPDGRLFFSLGVASILNPNHGTRIAGRERFFEKVPGAAGGALPVEASFTRENLVRRFGESWERSFAELVHARCRAWGFNTLGCWCLPYITALRRTPYTATINISSPTLLPAWRKSSLRPVPDVFSSAFRADLESQVERLAHDIRDDPWCIGVFVDNEIDWAGCGEAAGPAAEKYYATVREVLKKHLPNHLYLGSRIHQAPKDVWLAAARYCDVVSGNIYLFEPVDDLERYAPDKPFLIGEFHFGAKDRGMFGGGLCSVRNQAARGECLMHYIESCLDSPRYVGCHYYQMQDQELTGRFDGENWNIGFVSVCELPYREMVDALRRVASQMYARRFFGKSKQDN